MKYRYFAIILFTTFLINNVCSQNLNKFPYILKSGLNSENLSKHDRKPGVVHSNKVSPNGFELYPIYVDNMIWDQGIIEIPGENHNQIMNESWAYTHFQDQNKNPSTLFGTLEDVLFLPYDTMTTILALDSKRGTVFYFDKNNIAAGILCYGENGKSTNEFIDPSSFILGREKNIGSSKLFNVYICDQMNNRIVHVVYNAVPGNSNGFEGSPFDIVDTIPFPSDISYFKASDSTQDKLWLSSETINNPSICCVDLNGNNIQNINGYRQNGNDYLFLPDTRIKLTTHNEYFNAIVFIDTRRNFLITCALNPDGTANVVQSEDGQNLIQAIDLGSFPSDMIINSVKFQTITYGTQGWPYVWVTSGYLPPFYNNISVLHSFKMDAAGYLQYLGSTKKPGSTWYYFKDLKSVACRDYYYDLFTIEEWQSQYGVRRYLPYADIYNDSLRYYCADSVDNMRWVAQLTNECWTRFTAERKKQDGTWEQIRFKNIQVDGPVRYLNNDRLEAVVWNAAGWTEEAAGVTNGYIRMKLDLPVEDYILGGRVRLNMKLYPEWADSYNLDNFDGYVLNKSYETDVLKNCNPKPGGCPFVYVKGLDSNYHADNNILHRSEFTTPGTDITDKYKLRITPQVNSGNEIELWLAENENDSSYINQVRFYAIDHPYNTKMGITENNDVVLYDSASVVASDSVMLNSTNITSHVNFFYPDSIPTNGYKNDNLYAHFSYSSGSKLIDLKKNYFKKGIPLDKKRADKNPELKAKSETEVKNGPGPGPGNSPLIYAFISDLRNLTYPIASAKDTGGVLTATSIYSNVVSKIFARRELNSVVILPLFKDSNKVSNVTINWQSDFQMKYLGIATLQYSGFTSTELPLEKAYYVTSTLDSGISTALTTIDSSYGLVNSNGLIHVTFSASSLPPLGTKYVREYVVEVNGHYFGGSGSMYSNMHKPQGQTPYIFKLSQNYPNPFNPSTKINYEIPNDSKVKLVVYDILGREVIKLVNNEFKKTGRYVVDFDGTNLASGVYFYRIEAGNFVQSKKMVLIK